MLRETSWDTAHMTDRRPLGLPDFSEAAPTNTPTDMQRLLPIERAVFQSPPPDASERTPLARRSLAAGGLTFSDPVNEPAL